MLRAVAGPRSGIPGRQGQAGTDFNGRKEK